MLWLLNLLPGIFNIIGNLTDAIVREKIAMANATTEQERIVSQERINQMQAQRDVLIADSQKSKLDIIIRSIIGAALAFYLTKIFVYDKALHLGSTDAPSFIQEWDVLMVAIGFYFVSTMNWFKRG